MAAVLVKKGIVYGEIESPDGYHPALSIDVSAYVESAEEYSARLIQVAGIREDLQAVCRREVVKPGNVQVEREYLENLRTEVHRLQGLHKTNGRLHQRIKELNEDAGTSSTFGAKVLRQALEQANARAEHYYNRARTAGVGQLISLPPGLKMEGNQVVVDSLLVLAAHQAQQERQRRSAPDGVAVAEAIDQARSFYDRWGTTAGARGSIDLAPLR